MGVSHGRYSADTGCEALPNQSMPSTDKLTLYHIPCGVKTEEAGFILSPILQYKIIGNSGWPGIKSVLTEQFKPE